VGGGVTRAGLTALEEFATSLRQNDPVLRRAVSQQTLTIFALGHLLETHRCFENTRITILASLAIRTSLLPVVLQDPCAFRTS
jgi:hypothetical protein